MGYTFDWKGSVRQSVEQRIARLKPVLFDATKVEAGRVKQRTQAGTGLNTSFLGYSPSWAKKRRAKGLRTDIVDLTFTGAMFKSMQTTFTDSGPGKAFSVVSFGGNALSNLKATENNKSRPFFGFSKEQVDIILSKLRTTR